MSPIVQDRLDDLVDLCRRFHVARLELFGSAAADDGFDPEKSDLDFLVEFGPLEPGENSRCYFGMLFGLEDMFHRSVDLVMTRAIRNPYFLEGVNRNRVLLYAA